MSIEPMINPLGAIYILSSQQIFPNLKNTTNYLPLLKFVKLPMTTYPMIFIQN